MVDLQILVPRPRSRGSASERAEEEEFHVLVESIETLLFTSADHPDGLDPTVLAAALSELGIRWSGVERSLPGRWARP